ncbi:MAG: RHS repeat-associated core domain-containing protein [Candidatus Hodarchaeota archaeon]
MSTRQLTDATQEITDGYTYDAFGILLNKFGATVNDYMYTGEQYDPNVGFYYLRARYYNVSIGRFLTMDDFPGLMFEPLSLHKYLYCEGNPVDNLDPSGQITLTQVVVSLIIVSALWTIIGWSLSFLKGYDIPATWTGSLFFHSFSIAPYLAGPVFGFGFAILTGTHPNRKPNNTKGLYFMFGWGFGVGSPINWGYAPNVEIESPGLFAASGWVLIGYFGWGSLSWAHLYPTYSGAANAFIMGLGVSTSIGSWYGWDVGAEGISGFSIGIWW